MNKVINSPLAPKAIGPYSQAILAQNGMLYISGQIPIDPATGKVVDGGIEAQTHQVFKNITAILTEAGYAFRDVVKTTCLLNSMDDFATMNQIYGTYFTEVLPARAAYAVEKLPMDVLVEIEVIACK